MPFVGIGVGIGRQRFASGIFAAYAARVAADGGVTEAGACVNAVSGISLNSSLLLVPSGYKSGVVYSQIPTNGDGDLTFTRASDATRVNSDGEIEVVGSGVPRLDYSQGSCPALLLEPQRTNLLLQSEYFDDASWIKSGVTISANSTVSPDGSQNANKFIPNVNNNTHQIRQIGFTSAAYTFSVYAKAGEETTFSLWLRSASVFAMFDLSNGTITSKSASVVATITNVGNGWFRCTAYDPTPGTTAQIYGRNGSAFIGNGTDGFYIWGAQLEQGAYATSYIPTTSASVTRVADAASKTGISSLIGVNQGSIFIDFEANGLAASGGSYLFDLSDNSNFHSNRIAMYWSSSTNFTLFYGYGGTFSAVAYTANYLTTKKIAVRWTSSQIQVVIDGVAKTAITYGNSSPTKLNLGSRFNDVELLDVNIKQCVLFNTTQSVSDLVALTT